MMNTEQLSLLIKQSQGRKFDLSKEVYDGFISVTNNNGQTFFFDEEYFEELIELINLNKKYFTTHNTYTLHMGATGMVTILKHNTETKKLSYPEYQEQITKKYNKKKFVDITDNSTTIQLVRGNLLLSHYNGSIMSHTLILTYNRETRVLQEVFNGKDTFIDYLFSNMGEDEENDILGLFNAYKEDLKESDGGKDKVVTSKNLTEQDIPKDLREFVSKYIGVDTLKEALKGVEDDRLIPIRKPDFTKGMRDIEEVYHNFNVPSKSFCDMGDEFRIYAGDVTFIGKFRQKKNECYIELVLNDFKCKQKYFVEGEEPTVISCIAKIFKESEGDEDADKEDMFARLMKYCIVNQVEVVPC